MSPRRDVRSSRPRVAFQRRPAVRLASLYLRAENEWDLTDRLLVHATRPRPAYPRVG